MLSTPPMDLVRYLRVLRRHWRLIAAFAVIGAVVGFVLAPRPQERTALTGPPSYLATHTLFTPTTAQGATGSLSLGQIANLVTAGDVPERVATRIGGDPGVLANQVIAIPDPTLGTLEITAQDPDPDRAVVLADTVAEELQASLRDVQQRTLDQTRAVLEARLEGLRIEIVALPPADPADTLANARRDALVEEVRGTEQQLLELDRQVATGPAFSTLRTAEAFPVTERELEALFEPASGASTTVPGGVASSSRNAQFQAAQDSDGINPFLAALLGGAGGGLLAIAVVLAVNALDPRVFTKEQAEEAFGFPVIAEVPAFSRKQQKQTVVVVREAPYSRFAESFRVLRSSLLFVQRAGQLDRMATLALTPAPDTTPTTPTTTGPFVDGASTDDADDADAGSAEPDGTGPDGEPDGAAPPPAPPGVVVMVTSPGPSEGKTTTVSNLAAVLAEDGSRVLVVNCDFRRPRLHLYLHAPDQPRRVISTDVPGVKLVSGVVADRHPNPAEVVAAQRVLVANARTMFDYVLLDTAPILTTNDASDLLPSADMVVVICRAGKTTREAADRAAELLERFNAPVVGAVLVAATESPSARYYYDYHHDEVRSVATDTPEDNPFDVLVAGAGSRAGSRAGPGAGSGAGSVPGSGGGPGGKVSSVAPSPAAVGVAGDDEGRPDRSS
jgi:Mrp family chromosome partitioning ATPase